MNDVYLKNRTSSAITVAGYTVHYMDKTDAEIVEVEGSESISGSDDASGTIAAVTLPTAHSYTGVLFDSLRYYAKGTISNTGSVTNLWQSTSTWYYGTLTWTDESLGDLSDKIIVNSTSYSGMVRQTVFRIIFIYYANITGYHPMDTDSSQGQITNYSYNNGVHSITFYFAGTDWTSGTYSGRIQFRYLNGVTTFNNLNAFDLVSVSEGSLSKNTTSDRYDMYNVWDNSITIHAQYGVQNHVKYNAFKYLLSSVPYWYVIDGIQTDWTDDLSSIGYSEVQLLPIVTKRNDLYIEPDNYNHQIGSGSEAFLYEYVNGSYRGLLYDDTTKKQCVYGWMYLNSGTWERYYYGLSAVLKSGTDNSLGVRNDTSSTIDVTRILYAECSDPLAIIITVYNSQNAYFNAFKYTVDSIDYYYVLDGTQNDWTNDLSSIGYEIKDFEEITLYGNVSSTIYCQNNVTSGFTGNVNTANVLQLYTDNTYTTLWNGYDYSNDYEMGVYSSSGVWYSRGGTIADLPATTANPGNGETVSKLFVLLDTGCLWFVCNNSNSGHGYNNQHASFYGTITLRIRKKEQQVFSFYFAGSSVYDNVSLSYNSTYYLYSAPNLGTSTHVPSQKLPGKTLIRFLGSAGNVVSVGTDNFSWYYASPLQVNYNKTNSGTLAVRNVEVSFSEPIYYAKLNVNNITTSKNTAYALFNEDGTKAQYESGYTYTVAVLFKKNNETSTSQNEYINSCELGEFNPDLPGRLCFRYSYGSQNLVIQHIWYTKTPT